MNTIEQKTDILSKGRALMLKIVSPLSLLQINTIPEGHKNSIGWNIAHLVVTQQLLCYKMSNLNLHISDEMVEKYKKGTTPTSEINEKEWNEILELFTTLPEKLLEDYKNQKFQTYNDYTTSVNITLDNIEKAIEFNNFHEGIHLGVILSQKKIVS